MIAFIYLCVLIVLIFSLKSILVSLKSILSGTCDASWRTFFSGLIGLIIGLIASFVPIMETTSEYLPAEPIAYNSTQTVFTTDKGNVIADGIYPDGKYMLDMDGDTVLVVWQAVEGEEVGLG